MEKNTQVQLSTTEREQLVDKIIRLAEIMGETQFYPYQKDFAKRVVRSLLDNEGATISAIFSRQCIEENEFILDRDGNVLPISQYKDAWYTKTDELLQIKAHGGHTLLCTKEHPIMGENGWILAGDIKPNDKIVVLDSWEKFGDGTIYFMHNNECKSFHIPNEMLKAAGYIIFGRPKHSGTIFIKDNNIRCWLEPIINTYFKDIHAVSTKKMFAFRIEKSLYYFLNTVLGMSNNYPSALNYLTREQLLAFFEGAFLARGKLHRNVHTVFVNLPHYNKRLLAFCKIHLTKLGLHGNILKDKNNFMLQFACVPNYRKFCQLFPNLPSNMYSPVVSYVRSKQKPIFKGEDGENLTLARVTSVTHVGVGKVWDATFPNKGWFIANGIKVSNSGKSQTVAMVIAACMVILPQLAKLKPDKFPQFKKGFWAGLFAPVGEQAGTLFDRVYDILTTEKSKEILTGELRMPIPGKGGTRGNLIKLQNGSLCRMHSANMRSKVESKTYDLIVFDESQDIPSTKAKLSVLPMGAATNATVIYTGTPGYVTGVFYETIEQNKKHDVLAKEDEKLHFEADYTITQLYNPYYRKYIEKEKKRLGETSEEFQMSYRLIWPITKGMLFTKELLEEYVLDKSLTFEAEYKRSPCIAGLDLGKAQDSTVLTILKVDWDHPDEEGNVKKQVLDFLIIDGDDWESQYGAIVEKLGNYWIDTLVCDSTGLGDPVRERLEMLLPEINIIPFIFSPKMKDLGYKYLLQEIKAGRLKVPADERSRGLVRYKEFMSQMTSLKKSYSGKFLVPKPVDSKKGHDDIPDSLMLANYGTYYDAMPFIDEEDNSFFTINRKNYDILNRTYSRVRG